jgi:hypothetical protein
MSQPQVEYEDVREKIPKRFIPSRVLYLETKIRLIDRDGNFCRQCRNAPPEVKLEIHHTDNDPSHWDLRRLCLLCRHCNHGLKNLEGMSISEREKISRVAAPADMSEEMRRSLEYTPAIHRELQRLIQESGMPGGVSLTLKSAENRVAKLVGCSQVTVRRAMEREATPEGYLSISEKTILTSSNTRRSVQVLGMTATASTGIGIYWDTKREKKE